MHLHLIQTQLCTSGSNSHSLICDVIYVNLLSSHIYCQLCSETEFFLKGMVISNTQDSAYWLVMQYSNQNYRMQFSDINDFQACTEYKLMLSNSSVPYTFLCPHLINFKVRLYKQGENTLLCSAP